MSSETKELDDQITSLLDREWLVTNGLGGYASGTVGGVATRRYHGLLIAALPAPFGRCVMLNHLLDHVRIPGGSQSFVGGEEYSSSGLSLHGREFLKDFRLELGMPVWTYQFASQTVEKRIVLPYRQNTALVEYRLVEGEGPLRFKIRPSVHFRGHEHAVDLIEHSSYTFSADRNRYQLASAVSGFPPLRMYLHAKDAAFTIEHKESEAFYRVERARGYAHHGPLYSPGFFRATLTPDRPVTLVASSESWEAILALPPTEAFDTERSRRGKIIADIHPKEPFIEKLALAADQFIITPVGRVEDTTRARASGEEIRSVIAGYHWFTDWGRDTMISLEGLTLSTNRLQEARWILKTFARHVRNGLIPNMFPEGEREGLYHTADATLWFFHALRRYEQVTGDKDLVTELLPALETILEKHLEGTDFGIGVDPRDSLLRQGAEGYQLTWMDAKVDGWVVTPRRGKAVEINALWYNALMLTAHWLTELGKESPLHPRELAGRVAESFNERFWYEKGGYLYDVIDGEGLEYDTALRPNQIFSISLEHPVLAPERWSQVVDVVRAHLLTPLGLRSLSPGHPDYKARYDGDLRSRDAAYHQGTVWGWLIGPFVDAWLRVYPGRPQEARIFLQGFVEHLNDAGVGSISEVFDAEPPYTPRACIAQAWSVAEVLRCWLRTASH
jgi:predicted glycogen debranching enzyme